jgi:hypothetical protein
MLSPRARVVVLLVAAAFISMAMALPHPVAAYDICYFIQVEECYYDTGGYCYHACPSSSYCYGDVSGTPSCFTDGEDCCY